MLGAGGSSPPPGYAGPAILVDSGDARLLLDCGEGCLERLRALGYTPCEIDAVYITHAHVDHWSGLFPLAVGRIEEGCRHLKIYMHGEVAEELKTLLANLMPSKISVEVKPVTDGFRVESLDARLVPASHSKPTYAIGVYHDGSLKLLYTGDTRLEDNVVDALRRLGKPEVLVVEATLPSGREDAARESGHLTVSQALELGALLDAGLLIPVHLTPLSLRQLRAYRRMPRGVIVPVDGFTITV
ncbi:ribonuclease Z [Pyrolobus fumarii 1A]|uniref:Ribonuclease Z n=1 Tax=Pyrolobus fumarii (strain DSM 11204 / 1A) TaxID=694429 RepID=G0EHD3_PYRF1|nr:MBL fold metallo-hydrolase [Pyrolobus fumarii]AEM38508.1 ribonuclease Z [Pyrolobus fumarii 1A]